MSVIFEWKEDEIKVLLESCQRDESLSIIERHFPPGSRLLEAGCGLGRWVRFLNDRGYRITGLEYNADTVSMVKKTWPDLDVIQGDCEASPFQDNQFDGVLSFGVVEHWIEGPQKPLCDLFRILKWGGKAYISVPCHNSLRSLKRFFWWDELVNFPRVIAGTLLHRTFKPLTRLNRRYLFPVYPSWGNFFEYRMSPEDFRREVEAAGFHVAEHLPLGHIDGIYHDLNPFGLLVGFTDWRFQYGRIATALNHLLSRRPFTHSHMQTIIAVKRRHEERRVDGRGFETHFIRGVR